MGKINPEFTKEIKKYGGFDLNACYNCGNCTAVCSLSTEDDSFPREMVRFSVLGLEDEMKASLKPWSCYYCGECSEACPREANPGELMMSLRRWLSSKYDWTGLAGILYKSLPVSIIAFVILAIAVVVFGAYENFDPEKVMHFGHTFEIISIAAVFSIILMPNIIRMWWFTILKPKTKVPIIAYIKGIWELVVHMFTQKRALGCDDNQFRWFEHFILVLGYLALLFTTVVLDWFGTENMFIIILGYVESAVIFIVTIDFMSSRIKQKKEISKFSQPADWFFVIWLFLMGFTAFIVRILIDTDLIENSIWVYFIHLTVLVQWALIIVPFGKWTHFLYRSFAMYFQNLKELSSNTKK
ncbi:MAG: 4Fe-4S dicluster domain-containing protein [Bacteroidota bacterium]|nr:4Fe-4S dicluster domain-containing protein [Bacteroidota bacterium]